ncbi:MAG: DUF4377 domain-containing protein [Flavobacteriales bacterium]|nr:DUF4377 domain-containing protein [Flavobacteriales bacterium]
MRSFFLFFLLGIVCLGYSQKTATKTVTLNPYLSFQNYEHYKRLVLSSPDEPEMEFIADFDFEWGYSYTLKVKVITLSSTLSDGTRKKYELVKVIKKDPVPASTSFSLFIDPKIYYHADSELNNESLIKVTDDTYRYMDSVDIIIPQDLITSFEQIIQSGKGRKASFQFTETGDLLLLELL